MYRYPTLMDGPYRDLGSGFARLTGVEGLRRSPRRLRSVEDALFELLRNARDAGAANVYVASVLRDRRFRQLTVIDDGEGIPETHKHLIFEPGITTRHLRPVDDGTDGPPHGAGLSLHHIEAAAVSAEVRSPASPTSIRVVFDTRTLPERKLQSGTRPSATNLSAVISAFASSPNAPRLFHGSPASIVACLLRNRIIRSGSVVADAERLGLSVSSRTLRRVLSGEVSAADEVRAARNAGSAGRGGKRRRKAAGGPILVVNERDLGEVRAVLSGIARASYLDVTDVVVDGRPGEITVRARVYEPEDEYE